MRLDSLRLTTFRAHAASELAFAPKVNLLYGPNGAGKTIVLEAVHYLCLTKSFLSAHDGHVVQHGATFAEVEGAFATDRGSTSRVRLALVPDEGKRVFVNGAPLERLSEVVGRFPVVVLSPLDAALTAGGPDERRRLLDAVLSQAYPVYLDDLMKYRRALKQRNALLGSVRRGAGLPPGTLAAWDAELVTLGARLIDRRRRFLEGFASALADAFRLLDLTDESPAIEYGTVADVADHPDEAAVADRFRKELARVNRRERERGRTLVGPHLDDIVFRLNGFEVRAYASQGQHRTFGLALRLATFFFLRDHLDETPLLPLDDVFGPLDARRSALVLDLLASDAVGQSLVTAARPEPFADALPFEQGDHRALAVVQGAVIESPAPFAPTADTERALPSFS